MYVYKITNLINQKNYIGITHDINERFRYHKTRCFQPNHKEYNKALYKAFRKYGLENFQFDVLMSGLTEQEAREKEQELIKVFQSNTSNHGYNMTPGGEYDCAHGEKVNTALLTEQQVIDIRLRRNAGETVAEVYKDYNEIVTYSDFGKV